MPQGDADRIRRYLVDQVALGRGRADETIIYQGLQVGPGPLFVPVPAGIGDDHRRLRCEHDQGLLLDLADDLGPGHLFTE